MTDYALAVSEQEIQRYRFMAERAQQVEAELWRQAGVAPGAIVADVGCGPAAVSVQLARLVGPSGRVVGVERDDDALAAAHQVVAQAGVDNVELRQGLATDTGLPAAAYDVVMMRHVLAHNQRDEQAIVDHLATLARPGGSVYLVDMNGDAMHVADNDPELDDLNARYRELHARRGNDLRTGLRLGKLLRTAGLELVAYTGHYEVVPAPPGMRPPSWAAADALTAEGLATPADVQRWEAAFARLDAAEVRPTLFLPSLVAIGRRS